MKTWLLGIGGSVLSACVFTPEMVTRYDAACDLEVRHLVLTSQQTGLGFQFSRCTDEDCLATLLALNVLVVPVSAIVSGSIVLVGNTVFWMQKQGQCMTGDGTATAAELGPVLPRRA